MLHEVVFNLSRDAQLTSMKRFPDISSKIRRSNKPLDNYKQKIKNPLGLYSLNQLTVLPSKSVTEDENIQPWVDEIENKCLNHSGEAAIFAQKLLSPYKAKQQKSCSNLDCLSPFKRRFNIDSKLYCQTDKKKLYLLATPKTGNHRQTRSSNLRFANHDQKRKVFQVDANLLEYKRRKERPQVGVQTLRWLPTKYQTYETPNKFLIGTRYCFSRNIDIRSYGEMGLYVPRFPQHIENSTSFLSSFRGTESRVYNEFTREIKIVEKAHKTKSTSC